MTPTTHLVASGEDRAVFLWVKVLDELCDTLTQRAHLLRGGKTRQDKKACMGAHAAHG